MHHRSFFLPEELVSQSDQFSMETKDFIHGKFDWFKNLILARDAFEDGNMANIHQPSKSTSQQILKLLYKSCWGHPTPQKKLLPTNASSKNSATSLLGPTLKFLGWIHQLWNTTSKHGPMWPPCTKEMAHPSLQSSHGQS